MGAGDWNDGLSAIGAKGRSESVWLAHFLIGILEDWAVLEERRPAGDAAVARRYRREADKMRKAVNRHFWDGRWYVRATRDDGTPIGSRRNREGRIFLNAQTWAILNDVVPVRRLPAVLSSLRRHLYRQYGPLHPAYHAGRQHRLSHALRLRRSRERRSLHARRAGPCRRSARRATAEAWKLLTCSPARRIASRFLRGRAPT
jgi:hypothetical protein